MKIVDIQVMEETIHKAKRLPMCFEFMINCPAERLRDKHYSLKAMLINSFKWDATPEGHDYWQRVYDSIVVKPIPFCPVCKHRNKVRFLKRTENYKCDICKTLIK